MCRSLTVSYDKYVGDRVKLANEGVTYVIMAKKKKIKYPTAATRFVAKQHEQLFIANRNGSERNKGPCHVLNRPNRNAYHCYKRNEASKAPIL
jgi:hypothetical protein